MNYVAYAERTVNNKKQTLTIMIPNADDTSAVITQIGVLIDCCKELQPVKLDDHDDPLPDIAFTCKTLEKLPSANANNDYSSTTKPIELMLSITREDIDNSTFEHYNVKCSTTVAAFGSGILTELTKVGLPSYRTQDSSIFIDSIILKD